MREYFIDRAVPQYIELSPHLKASSEEAKIRMRKLKKEMTMLATASEVETPTKPESDLT